MPSRPATILIEAPALVEIVTRCCQAVGLPPADAGAVAEVLLYANLRGQDGHGLVRLTNYMRRVESGLAGDRTRVRAVAGTGPLRRLDGGQAIGPAAAIEASDMSAELGREHGVALVALGNVTHFGPAGFYARRVAQRGLISIVLSNGPKAVAPYGTAEELLGTNPLALGIPIGAGEPMVVDMATSAIARGTIRRAVEIGTSIPGDVAVDAAGRPTRDPRAALEGSILPIAGPKGSGLALAISMLAILLADAQADDEIVLSKSAPSGGGGFPLVRGSVGQVFLAVDPGPMLGDSSMERAEALVDRLRALPPAEGFEKPRLPGETGDARAAQRIADGIPIETALLTEIAETCLELGLDSTAAWLEAEYPGAAGS